MKGHPPLSGLGSRTPDAAGARRIHTTGPPDLGLRRISWVKVELLADGQRCAVVGVSHRLPVERSVPLGTALRLWRSGVPAIVRRHHNLVSTALAGSD